MKKITIYFSIILFMATTIAAQTIGKYKYKEKEYYVFPYRLSGTEDIPLIGLKIPDGDYIAFLNYNFKEKPSLNSKKNYKITDTTIVGAVFTIKNNATQGRAVFYSYHISKKGKQSHKPYENTNGNFMNGLKTGLWLTARIGKDAYEQNNYQNGMRQGYHIYKRKNGSGYKEKFFEGNVCDTLFFYENGKITREYDVLPRYTNYNDTIIENEYKAHKVYTKVIELVDVINITPKSFYKEYDANGKLTLDLKYKNGEVLPFDSLGTKRNKETIYGTVKLLGGNKKLLTFTNITKKTVYVLKEYYDGDFMYQSSRNYYKPSTLERKSVNEDFFTDPSTLNDSIVTPRLAVKETYGTNALEKYYIPKYKFSFVKSNSLQYVKTDTVQKKILFNETTGYYNSFCTVKQSSTFLEREQKELDELHLQPFMLKKFITDVTVQNIYYPYSYFNVTEIDGYETASYYKLVSNKTYYKNDSILNGNYYFSPIKKAQPLAANITYVSNSGIEKGMRLGNFSNGKKEGFWQNLYNTRNPKKTPNNLKDYYFKHPKKVDTYNETYFKNGLLDGNCIYYEKYNPKYYDKKSKDAIILYKSIDANFTRDTLNGLYKQFFSNGKLKKETHFVMGSVDGDYKEYNYDGALLQSIQFDKGKLHGVYKRFREGTLTQYGVFKNNKLSDSLVYYSANIPRMVLYAKEDRLQKKATYFEDGTLKEVTRFTDSSGYMLSKESISSESFIESLKNFRNITILKAEGDFKNYYPNGQLLSEGKIKNGQLSGLWKFYAINNVAIHVVNFIDTSIFLPNSQKLTEISGFYTGYYTNGNKRCEGYTKDVDLSYDCFTKQDKVDLDFYALTFYDINGKQTLKTGNGYFIKYEANGLRLASGKLVNCMEDSLWKYYTPEQKLNEIGTYFNHKKEGVWYEGSLEGINFEDGACFDMSDPDAVKAFEEKRKDLKITRIIYKDGKQIERQRFNSNLNKTYEPSFRRRRSQHVVDF